MARFGKDKWSFVALGAVALITAILVTLAVIKTSAPTTQAVPAATPSATSSTPAAATTPTTPTTPKTQQPSTALTGIATTLHSPQGASVVVIGDGSGDQVDEWVAVWARDHLSQEATVSYRAWEPTAARYAAPTTSGTGTARITLWNASTDLPLMPDEPKRIAKAWQTTDVVLLSYGHRRSAAEVSAQLDAVLAAIRKQDADVPVVVLLQNPNRATTEANQRAATLKIKEWADAHDLPTVDIYAAFEADARPRNDLVEGDGSPSRAGSALWARTLADALKLA